MIEDESGKVNPYDKTWERIIEKYVHPDDREEFREKVSTAAIKDALKDTDVTIIPFRAVMDG